MTTILIVDDDKLVRESMKAFLEQNGFSTETACNGDEALQIATDHMVDVAVIDIYMPQKDGLETIMAMKKDGRGLRIIATTGAQDTGGGSPLDWATRLGANRVLQKPIDPASLLRMIAELEAESGEPPN
ncbi:MAG: response regulator [Rhodospirillales bacterium]|nr:response regulator [Rhodospirillales bacterium]